MLRYNNFLRANAPRFLLPLLIVFVAASCYFAGHYIGTFDAKKLNKRTMQFTRIVASADELKLYGMLLEEVKEGHIDAVTRLLEVKARLASPSATECMRDELCAHLAAPTPETQTKFRELVMKYPPLSGGVDEK